MAERPCAGTTCRAGAFREAAHVSTAHKGDAVSESNPERDTRSVHVMTEDLQRALDYAARLAIRRGVSAVRFMAEKVERPKISAPANAVHIRRPDDSSATFCGQRGGTVSASHVREQPQHVASLPMCQDCVRLAQEVNV